MGVVRSLQNRKHTNRRDYGDDDETNVEGFVGVAVGGGSNTPNTIISQFIVNFFLHGHSHT